MEVQSSQSINQSVWCVEPSAPPQTETQGGGGCRATLDGPPEGDVGR